MGLKTPWPGSWQWKRDSYLPVLALAFLLRIVWVLAVPVHPVSDSYVYNLLAQSLASGHGYYWAPGIPTAYWPVGTSFVYSIIYRVFGASFTPIVVFNLAISLGTIWLTMVLAERWFDRRVAIVAGYISACWPLQIEFASVLASELIFNFLLVSLLAVWETRRLNPWVRAILIGIFAAATCYIRPTGMLLPAILYAITVNRERKYLRPIAGAAIALVVMALAIAPWSVRNTHIFGHFELISTNGGANLWMGNNPDGTGRTEDVPDSTLKMPEAERDIYLGKIAKAYIREHPVRFALRTFKKVYWLHDHETIGVHWNLAALQQLYGERAVWCLKLLSDTYWWLVLLLGLTGAVLVILKHGIWVVFVSVPLVLWAYFTALHAVIVVQDRYHFPCLPFIAILAGVAICEVRRRIIAREIRATFS